MDKKKSYEELANINVSEHVEKKGKFNYLSWAWAVDTLLRNDPDATWEYKDEKVFADDTQMVFCTVKAFGRERTMQLPVLDFKNQAIKNPNAFQVNTAMQRCLAKAIALHGIGLYIYAGEDLPEEERKKEEELSYKELSNKFHNMIGMSVSHESLEKTWQAIEKDIDVLPDNLKDTLIQAYQFRKETKDLQDTRSYTFLSTEVAREWFDQEKEKLNTFTDIKALQDHVRKFAPLRDAVAKKLTAEKDKVNGKLPHEQLQDIISATFEYFADKNAVEHMEAAE